MIFSKSRKEALELLKGGVWHTTSKKRFDGIIADGFIRVSPNIPNASRWKTSGGPDCYPFVRKLGGISLFDFRDFDEVEYSSRCPMSSWHEFVPVCSGWESSIWIEINIKKLGTSFVDGAILLQRWKDEAAYRHAIMPYIEACSLADIPTSTFIRNIALERTSEFK